MVPLNGIANPRSLGNLRKVNLAKNCRHKIRAYNTDNDGHNFYHALSPDITDNHQRNRDERNRPVVRAVGNCRLGQRKTNRNDNRTCYHRREKLHNLSRSKYFNQTGKHKIDKTGARHAKTGVGNHLHIGKNRLSACVSQLGTDGKIAAQKSKGGTQKSRHPAFCQ